MRNLIVLLIAALLGYVGQKSGVSEAEPVWALGMLLILASLGAEMAERIGLPSVVGCAAAGLVLGPYGSRLISPEALTRLELVRVLAVGWIAIQIGAGLRDMPEAFVRKVSVLAAFVTFASCALTVCVLLAIGVPVLPSITLGIIASSFGPFALFSMNGQSDLISMLMAASVMSVFALWSLLAFGVEVLGPSGRTISAVLPILEFLGAIGLGCCLAVVLKHLAPRLASPTSRILGILGAILLLVMVSLAFTLNPVLPALVGGVIAARRSIEVRAVMADVHVLSRPLHHLLFALIGAYIGVGADLVLSGRFWPVLLVYVGCMVMGKLFIAAIGVRILKIRESSREPFEIALLPQGVVAFELLRMSRERFVGIEAFQSSWDLICATVTIGLLLGMIVFPVVTRRIARLPGGFPETLSEQAS